MSKKIITKKDEMYGVWKILEPNVINPNTKEKQYIGRDVFSYCLCTNCNQTKKYIKNNELKEYSTKLCKSCTRKKITSSSIPQIGEKFNLLTVIADGGYENSRHWSICECECGNIIRVRDNSLKTGNTISCGCLSSKGENKIKTLLEKNNYIFNQNIMLPQFFKDTNRKLRFDFVVYNNRGEIDSLIEFDGRQHIYGPDTTYWGHSSDTLQSIQERDKIKNIWCIQNNYKLYRIPYYYLDKLTIELLFDEKFLVKE